MTGLGFTRHGQDSYKSNRKLLNSRPLMKDNLLPTSKDTFVKESQINYEELKQYNLINDKIKRKTRMKIYSIILASVILVVIVIMLLNQP